ncbi:serine hydrolase [Larkinella terrae]|uniref:Serine hydrolase n=1 Tax=Larkinella terrae TaxID=2025311 RepID=A0A7K0ERV6_9BACT|nr:serine hydrolase [Larkinella terrae]MRS64543.1 serine hydrolase [Larkinella terrae]
MRTFQIKLISLALLGLVSFPSVAQNPIKNRIDSLMQAAHQLGVFNGNVLVVHRGVIQYRNSLGYADGSRNRKLTLDHLFDIGSISKEFNGAALLLLQQQGKLSLTDRLSQFLKELPSWADSIQLKHLINYTSGLPITGAMSDQQILDELKTLKTLAFRPGNAYAYSYSNVYLQRRIIERISGQTYAAFITENLLKPLQMNHTFMDLPVTAPEMTRAFDSNFKESTYEQQMTGWPRLSIDDLYSWLVKLDGYQLVNKAAMQVLAVDFGGNESSLGHAVFKNDKLTWHQHHGSSYNYEALMTHDLENDIVVILMTNSQQFKVNALTNSIIAILQGKPYTVPKRSLYLDLREKVLADFNQGIAFYRQVREQQRDRYDLGFEVGDLVNTGKYLMRRQRYEEAIRLFQLGASLPVQPGDYSYAYQLIADCYAKMGLKQLAIVYYQKAIEKDPTNENAKGYLAELVR